jgi:hypothetical protein
MVWLVIGAVLCVIPLLIYLIVYASERDSMIILRLQDNPALAGGSPMPRPEYLTWSEDRRLLVALLGDIEGVLAKGPSGQTDTSGLESLAVKFEADHPALADGLRRLADTLAKAGI